MLHLLHSPNADALRLNGRLCRGRRRMDNCCPVLIRGYLNGIDIALGDGGHHTRRQALGQGVTPSSIDLANARAQAIDHHLRLAAENYAGPQSGARFDVLDPAVVKDSGMATVDLC